MILSSHIVLLLVSSGVSLLKSLCLVSILLVMSSLHFCAFVRCVFFISPIVWMTVFTILLIVSSNDILDDGSSGFGVDTSENHPSSQL